MRAVQSGERAGRRRVRRVHRHVRAVPRLRAGVPVGRAVRSADGGHRHALAEAADARHPVAAARLRALGHHRLLLAGSTALAVAQRVHLVPRRVAARLGLPAAPGAASPLQATGDDVWLFTGCVMDAWQRPVHAAALRVLERHGRRRRASRARAAAAAARSTCTPGSTDDAATPRPAGHGGAARRRADPRRLRRLRRRAEGLRPPPRHRPGAAFSARVHDVHEWLATRPRPPADADAFADAGRGAGPVPPPPRAARPPAQSARCWRRTSSARRARRRGAVLRRRRRLRGAAARAGRRHPGRKLDAIARSRRRRSSPAPTRAARCTSPPPASTSVHPIEIVAQCPRRAEPSMAGEFDDIRRGSRPSPRSWPTSPSSGCASRSTRAAPSCPVDERRLTRARRAVEKAIGDPARARRPLTSRVDSRARG